MATEDDLISNLINCTICLERFTDPRTLPCLHSFCKDCIDRLPKHINRLEDRESQSRYAVECPLCRQRTPLTASGFPAAFMIKNFMEVVDKQQRTTPAIGHQERLKEPNTLDAQQTCSFCTDRCIDLKKLPCHHWFCENCTDSLPVKLERGRDIVKCPLCSKMPQHETQFMKKGEKRPTIISPIHERSRKQEVREQSGSYYIAVHHSLYRSIVILSLHSLAFGKKVIFYFHREGTEVFWW